MALIGRTVHGNLRIKGLIGKGAMGLMLLVENVELPDRKYAVKVLRSPVTSTPKFQDRFSEEARNQAALDHPNIVRVHDYFQEAGRYFLVMDYVDGQSLQKVISDRGQLDEHRAIEILDGVLQALDCAHSHGVIHRDVKPSNILIDGTGRARLTDFGIAVRAGGTRLTGAGVTVIGTAEYMSPEQIKSPLRIDPRSDVYSCVIVLFEMLTGDVPFRSDSDYALSQLHVTAAPPDPRALNPAISQRVARIIAMALAKDPRDRPQDCEQFRRLLAGTVNPPFVWKPLAWVAAAAILGLAAYWSAPAWQRALSVSRSSALASDAVQAKESAAAAIQSIALLCREAAVKLKKEEGKKMAEQVPDSAVAENFSKQIAETQRNMAEFAQQYNRSLRILAKLEQPARIRALRDGATNSERAEYVGYVERDALSLETAPGDLDAGRLAKNCGGSARPR
ncbi:MAG: Serine/threonine-protein kinase pknB [Gammaproteobacteria bacterium]|nr:Serine/threonine-protein kinase pknB [Gammaproteobacteria bacterium]